MTPMVKKNFEDDPSLKAQWENGNMVCKRIQNSKLSLNYS